MSIDAKTFSDSVERWQSAEPMELNANFHALQHQGSPLAKDAPDLNQQFVQVDSFTMSKDDLDELKNQEIHAMFLWMALDDFDRKKFTFQPILEIENDKGRFYYGFDRAPYTGFEDTQVVPTPFVKNTRAVWRQMNTDDIANVFINEDATGAKRVRYFMISDPGLGHIKSLLKDASVFQVLPGIDLNKETQADDVLFVPIIHIAVGDLSATSLAGSHDAHLHGFGWSVNDNFDDNIFFDYTRPCPPVCNNH